MIVTTTPYIEGRHILEYKGIVAKRSSIESVSLFSTIDDNFQKTYKKIVDDIKQQRVDMGANAIVGVQINDNVATICVTGTAVLIE